MIPVFFLLSGILFTKTRSDILILSFLFLVVYLSLKLFKKDYKNTIFNIFAFLALTAGLFFVVFPSHISDLAQRLSGFFGSKYLVSAEAINRENVWDTADYFLKNLKFFGNGLFEIKSLSFSAGSFHSLYLTLLFKIGILGLFLHMVFWAAIIIRSGLVLLTNRNSKNWYLIFFLLIAVVAMLLDGIKIEYLRYDHTIQFAWMIYGLLAVSLLQSEKNDENTMVSQASV
jgi:hypothetical protein